MQPHLRAWIVSILLLLVACSEGKEGFDLVVQLRSDLIPGEEFEQIEVTILPLDGDGASRRLQLEADRDGYFQLRRIVELEALPPEDYRLGVSLLGGDGGVAVERPVHISIRENLSVDVPIPRSCQSIMCPEELACFGGECVDPRCSLSTPEFCGDLSLCESDADCSVEATCGAGECVSGTCWFRPFPSEDAQSCGNEGQYCDPEQGCRTSQGSDVPEPPSKPTDPSCRDGVQGAFEDGVDCGGAACLPCTSLCQTQTSIPQHECAVLVALYEDTNGDFWDDNTAWNTAPDPCDWFGVSCVGGHVDEILLDENSLSGALPDALGNLTEITTLRITENRITGTLPESLQQMGRILNLEVGSNLFNGSLPEFVGNMSSLSRLWMFNCNFIGTVPASYGELSNLSELQLQGSDLSGALPENLLKLRDNPLVDLTLHDNDCWSASPEMTQWIESLNPSWQNGC